METHQSIAEVWKEAPRKLPPLSEVINDFLTVDGGGQSWHKLKTEAREALQAGNIRRCLARCERYLKMLQSEESDHNTEIVYIKLLQCEAYTLQQKLDLALQAVTEAGKLLDQCPGITDGNILKTYYLRDHGVVLRSFGRIGEALPYFQRVAKTRRIFQGERHPDTAVALVDLGLTYKTIGQYERALQFLVFALSVFEQFYGPDSVFVATNLLHQGSVYIEAQCWSQALQCLKQGKKIMVNNNYQCHPDLATIEMNIGIAAMNANRKDEAIISFNNALEMRVKMYGEWHYYTAQVNFYIAKVLQKKIEEINEGNNKQFKEKEKIEEEEEYHTRKALFILESTVFNAAQLLTQIQREKEQKNKQDKQEEKDEDEQIEDNIDNDENELYFDNQLIEGVKQILRNRGSAGKGQGGKQFLQNLKLKKQEDKQEEEDEDEDEEDEDDDDRTEGKDSTQISRISTASQSTNIDIHNVQDKLNERKRNQKPRISLTLLANIATCKAILGQILARKEDNDGARDMFIHAKQLFESFPESSQQQFEQQVKEIEQQFANVLIKQGNNRDALQLYESMLERIQLKKKGRQQERERRRKQRQQRNNRNRGVNNNKDDNDDQLSNDEVDEDESEDEDDEYDDQFDENNQPDQKLPEILYGMGNAYQAIGNLNKAIRYYRRAIRLSGYIYGIYDIRISHMHMQLGNCYYSAELIPDAMRHYQQSRGIRERRGGEALGSGYYALGRHTEALELYKKALDNTIALCGDKGKDVQDLRRTIAEIIRDQHQPI
ncbi:MAG: hypothetical protein EZS28_003157 [Streblomastix strix]|uniref:Tetratricopeptide repeat protein n=1 Tax=Streblomastix strix TaxID=222440 RepID=A0A5J4X2Q1_9EUKA|nr:MAG: hypothetical protein EZS28_003157 [Streblomastix strix]